MFDYLVIGKGLMGTAATRYLSQGSASVAVMGPDEPEDVSAHEGVFASHYDQGRITRRLSKDIVWARLAARAIDQYAAIESESGIRFYRPTGGLYVAAPGKDDGYLDGIADVGRQLPGDYDRVSAAALPHAFPFLQFPAGCQAILEHPPAGYINPRALIQAQLSIASKQGAKIIRETAVSIQRSGNYVTVTTDSGQTYQAGKVLVAAGAFTNFHGLLPRKLDLRLKTETIIMAHVDEDEVARLAEMPTVIYQIDSPVINSIYLLPPIQYPDGRYYLKMGCNTIADQKPQTLAEVRDWFIRGNSDVSLTNMEQALRGMIPELKTELTYTGRCIITYTPHGKPFVDRIDDRRLFVATGGNGSSAKCSDTLGWLAAGLVSGGEWPSSTLDPASFTAAFT